MKKSDLDAPRAEHTQLNIKEALLNPASAFKHPKEVIDCGDLSREQKIEMLRRWEYDVRELQVADEEGMTAPRPKRSHWISFSMPCVSWAPPRMSSIPRLPSRAAADTVLNF